MKKIWLIILTAIMALPLSGEKIAVLTDVLKPEQFLVAGERFYIMESTTIFIYSLKDFTLIKKFGRKGEGPGEMNKVPFISNALTAFGNKKILVDAINKIIIFSGDGIFVKEVRKKGRVANVLSVGAGFVATRLKRGEDKKSYAVVNLMDAEMNVSKELYAQLMPVQGRNLQMVTDSIHVAVHEDKIFIEESVKGFIIEVFDSKGNALYKIKKEVPPLKVTAEDKDALLQELKDDELAKLQIKRAGGWDNFKTLLDFHYPDHYPPIRDMLIKNRKIYIRTFITQNEKEKYRILDLKGKDLKTVFLPKPMLASIITRIYSRTVRFFDISNDTYYYLAENEDDEEWELHSVPIR